MPVNEAYTPLIDENNSTEVYTPISCYDDTNTRV